jgi:hypothetical protein
MPIIFEQIVAPRGRLRPASRHEQPSEGDLRAAVRQRKKEVR